jgi:hypothetical protein
MAGLVADLEITEQGGYAMVQRWLDGDHLRAAQVAKR